MNTKGHPLRVAFCIYFKPVSLKKRTLSALPAPLPFFPSQDVRAILPAPLPSCLPHPVVSVPGPSFPRSVHRAQKKSPALPGDHQTRYGQGRHAPRPMTGTAFFEGKGELEGRGELFPRKKVPLSPSIRHHSTPGPRGPARKRSFPLPSRRRKPRRSPHVRLRPDGAGPGHP